MPWRFARLRGQRVVARVNEDGTFVDEGGRVEIRYKQTDARAYRAATKNLQLEEGETMPDSACPEGTFVEAKAKDSKEAKGKAVVAAKVEPGAWIAYTDGACSGNPGPAGLGFVLVAPDGKMHDGYEYLGVGTNNVAELAAVERAVECAPHGVPAIVVHTDSSYAIGVLSKGWKAKANQELVAKIRTLFKSRNNIRMVYVPGHSGVPLNERADELARTAIQMRSAQLPKVK